MIVVIVVVLLINVKATIKICGSDDSGDCGCVIDKYERYSKYLWY